MFCPVSLFWLCYLFDFKLQAFFCISWRFSLVYPVFVIHVLYYGVFCLNKNNIDRKWVLEYLQI